jgi:hypothetical protein
MLPPAVLRRPQELHTYNSDVTISNQGNLYTSFLITRLKVFIECGQCAGFKDKIFLSSFPKKKQPITKVASHAI